MGGYEEKGREGGDYITLQTNGEWQMKGNQLSLDGLCQADPNEGDDQSNRNFADYCMENGDGHDVHATSQTLRLNIAKSGFVNPAEPGTLNLFVDIPKYFYNPTITFENSTNDAAEYNWAYGG